MMIRFLAPQHFLLVLDFCIQSKESRLLERSSWNQMMSFLLPPILWRVGITILIWYIIDSRSNKIFDVFNLFKMLQVASQIVSYGFTHDAPLLMVHLFHVLFISSNFLMPNFASPGVDDSNCWGKDWTKMGWIKFTLEYLQYK